MSLNVLSTEDLELETFCHKCGYLSRRNCEVCSGTGMMPTTFGQKILDFIKKYNEFTAPDRTGDKERLTKLGDKHE